MKDLKHIEMQPDGNLIYASNQKILGIFCSRVVGQRQQEALESLLREENFGHLVSPDEI